MVFCHPLRASFVRRKEHMAYSQYAYGLEWRVIVFATSYKP